MKQKAFAILSLLALIVVLIGLNAASYTQKEETPDREYAPNRSTYHVGATGTRALYDLLAETGRKTVRWQQPPSALSVKDKSQPQIFVIIGQTRREFEEVEIEQILRWTADGGKLVIIDRSPPEQFLSSTGNWSVKIKDSSDQPFVNTDPTDQMQMTDKVSAAKPAQPTIYTDQIKAVQPSRFASSIILERLAEADTADAPLDTNAPVRFPTEEEQKNQPSQDEQKNDGFFQMPTPTPNAQKNSPTPVIITGEPVDSAKLTEQTELIAPVVHLSNDNRNLLVDVPYGAGQIVFLTDPYIVSNGGINLVDNVKLAINVIASRDGVIAFDEYHQGYGTNNNPLLAYFAGTPLVAFFLQFAVLMGVILYTKSRRFARPLPEDEPNRLSKLEYVAAMAELQQRTKAFDLAIENIYTDFRRRAARAVGVDNLTTSRENLAGLIAERAKLNQDKVDNLMFQCEDIIRGEPTNKREVVQLISRLREIETKLGLQRRIRR